MRPIIALLFLTISAACAQTQSVSDLIVGKFRGEFSTTERTLNIALNCSSATECLFDWDKSKGNKFNKVTQISDFEFASNALECARRRTPSLITNPETIAEQSRLEPTLASGAKLEKCWDMNNPTPTYTLACTVNLQKFREENIYLFVAAPGSRGEGACGYMIFPLSRQRG